jgi:hypothetical protein
MTKDEALAMDLALEALEYIENNYMSLPKSGSEAINAIKQARSAPIVQEPVAFNAGVPPLYPEMKDGETISVEYTTPSAAQEDIQRLSALVRAQQITIDKLEAQRQWVGLTDEDKLMCWARATHDADVEHKTEHQCLMDYGTEIEAKLRSKNNG